MNLLHRQADRHRQTKTPADTNKTDCIAKQRKADPFIYCSAWLRLKLITKVSFHNFPLPDPQFSPPQTFSPVKVMEKAQQVKCSLPMIGN